MRYKKEEITESYSKYLDAEKNQEDIFAQLRLAIGGLVSLESFSGDGAVAAKNYLEDIHMGVLDTFGKALMELEIRFLVLKQGFEGSVDDSGVAILDEKFISDKKGELNGHRTNMETINVAAVDAVSKIINDVALKSLPYQECVTSFNTLSNKIDAVLDSMSTFNSQHLADLSDFNRVFPLFDQAFSFMEGVIKPEGFTYSRDNAIGFSWLHDMSDYRFRAFLFSYEADPKLFQTFYLAVLCNCGFEIFGMIIKDADIILIYHLLENNGNEALKDLASASEDTKDIWEMIQAMRSGLVFTTVEENGSIYIKITTRSALTSLSNADLENLLKHAGAPVPPSNSTLYKLFKSDKGLCVWGNNRQYSTLFGKVDDWDSAAKLAQAIKIGDFSEAGNLSKAIKILNLTDKAGKILGPLAYTITAVLDVGDSFYDKRTDSFSSSFDGARLAGSATGDALYGAFATLSGVAAAALAGAAYGSVLPGIGTAVGLVVGIGIGLAGNLIKWGEPKESLLDHVKDSFTEGNRGIANWFKKVFG